ncbi:hypothetical protein D9M71_537990 [compost metagenome]
MSARTEFQDIGAFHINVDDPDILRISALYADLIGGLSGIANVDCEDVPLRNLTCGPGTYRDGQHALRVAFEIVVAETTVERFDDCWCR